MVGWDSVDSWYQPMMRQVDLLDSLDAAAAEQEDSPPARTDVTVGFEVGGISPVLGSGSLDVVRGSVPLVCALGPNSWPCLLVLAAIADNGNIDLPGSESPIAGEYLGELDFSDQMPEPYQFVLENYAPKLMEEGEPWHIMPRGPTEERLEEPLFDDDGLTYRAVPGLASFLGVGPGASEDTTADYSLLMAMHSTTEAARRSMINLEEVGGDPLPNTVVWAIQALAWGLRLDEAGWPTREAAWRAILDQECATLDVALGSPPACACADDVLVDLVGPAWADGAAGALWLFRPSSSLLGAGGDPLWSGAPWKPGRLPAPGP